MKHKAFTLLEILLVIAAIGILAAIVIVAINPQRQLAVTRNAERQNTVNTLKKSLDQVLIDNESYPSGITNEYQEICATGSLTLADALPDPNYCDDKVDLRGSVVPNYIASIPQDPGSGDSETGYLVAINPSNQQISIISDEAELQEEIVVNLSLQLGQEYAGGYVTHIFEEGDLGYDQGNIALIAAPDRLNINGQESFQWGCVGQSISGTSVVIGSGPENNDSIINFHDDTSNFLGNDYYTYEGNFVDIGCERPGGVSSNNGEVIATQLQNLTINGYSDWYLPSRNESGTLLNLPEELNSRINFEDAGDGFFTSTEYTPEMAWIVIYNTNDDSGFYPLSNKDTPRLVWPVRMLK